MTPLPDIQEEITPKKTILAAIPGETVIFDTNGVLKYPLNVTNLTMNPLSELARHILGIIGSYECVNTKQITDVLNLLGIAVNYKHLTTATDRLKKAGLIHIFRFKNENESKPAGYVVYILSRDGEAALSSMGIVVNKPNAYNVVMDPTVVKKKLATNQILFAYLKRNTYVTRFDKSKRFSVECTSGETVAVRPSLILQFKDQSTAFYEVVRQTTFWETDFENKLLRYKTMFDNYETEIPQLIICAENQSHARKIHKMVQGIKLEAFLTHDLLFFGSDFDQHIFTIDEQCEIENFKISFDEEESTECG